MQRHHEETLNFVISKLQNDPDVIGILLGGSIAHGYDLENSDVDIMIIVNNERYIEMEAMNNTLYFETADETYEGGYVDGKFITVDFINAVAEKGSEPARYAFKDCKVVYSTNESLQNIIKKASRYPLEHKETNQKRFYMQLNAWKWYYYEAKKKENLFLLNTAINNFVLYSSRLMLTYNEMLYPYYKWMFKELEKCNKKPVNFIENLNKLVSGKDASVLEKVFDDIKNFAEWDADDKEWGKYFLRDVEQVWLKHEPHISDI